MVPLLSSAGTPDPGMPWLAPLIAIAGLLLGSGGVVAWRRLSHDKRIGIAQQETVEDDALSNRWKSIIEAQTKVLLDPMTSRINTLETKVDTLEQELEDSRRKYWSAVTYIRQLLTWISRHLPSGLEDTQVPAPPTTVVEDI
uniref:Minor tail protein n=2 Tax=unclassified bacterial viruses TaxID=12333 RepID=A0AAU7J8H6_9VIRU